MPTDFLVLRHGQSVWNASGRWQGQGDPPLSERGREQALSVAGELVAEAPTRLVASDLVRARETAEILGAELGLEVELEPGFREQRYYVFDGGCVWWEFDFDDGVSATLAVELGDRLELISREQLSQNVSEDFMEVDL